MRAIFAPLDEDADLARVTLAFDAEARRASRSASLRAQETKALHVAAARRQIEHDIGHALAWAVIGEAAAAAGPEHREPAGREQLARIGAGAGGVDRRDAPAARRIPEALPGGRSPRRAPPWPQPPRRRARGARWSAIPLLRRLGRALWSCGEGMAIGNLVVIGPKSSLASPALHPQVRFAKAAGPCLQQGEPIAISGRLERLYSSC